MSELLGVSTHTGNVVWLSLTCIILFLLPILFAAVWRKKWGHKARFKALLIGALGFIVTVRILELGVHMFCIVLDNPVSRFINGHVPVYVLYGILMAGVFEECGRYVILRYIVKKENTYENAVMYGIGHGGIEVWVITLASMIAYLLLAVMLNKGGTAASLEAIQITKENAATILPLAKYAAAFGVGSFFVVVLERVLCMFIHIFLTVIVYKGVKKAQKKDLYLAIILHMLFDLMPALAQKITLSPIIVEGWLVLWTVIIYMIVKKSGHTQQKLFIN